MNMHGRTHGGQRNWTPGVGILSCLMWVLENNLGLLREQYVLLATEPSL